NCPAARAWRVPSRTSAPRSEETDEREHYRPPPREPSAARTGGWPPTLPERSGWRKRPQGPVLREGDGSSSAGIPRVSRMGKSRREIADTHVDLRHGRSAITEDEATPRRRPQVTEGERPHRHALARRRARNRHVVTAGWQPRREMHAGICGADLQAPGQLLPDRLHQRGTPLHVELAHPADVTGEMSLAQEVGHDDLVQRGRESIGGGAGCAEGFGQIPRQHEIPEAQGGKEHFAEGADVNDAAIGIQPLKRGNRVATEAEFTVVIVF